MTGWRSQGRIDYDLWDYDIVDTVEGNHYRVIDLAGNYHGSYHNEVFAQGKVWEHNVEVAAKQGRLYRGRTTGVMFILMDENVRGKIDVGTMQSGKVIMNQAGDRIWVPDAWFNDLLKVNGV
jgi:hypothetical protein